MTRPINSGRYRARYTRSKPFGYTKHSYQVIGAKGGVHLHITDYGENRPDMSMPRYSTGIEFHYRKPPEYMTDRPPSHDECWLLKCPCWHDGSSTYAQETWLPRFEYGAAPEGMLNYLCAEADERFGFAQQDDNE